MSSYAHYIPNRHQSANASILAITHISCGVMTTPSAEERAARVSARSALVGALIGGLLTGTATFAATWVTITKNANQDQLEFIRNQRLTVYAKISIDNSDAINAERDLAVGMDARNLDPDSLKSNEQKVATVIDQLRQDYFSVELLGSQKASDAVGRLLDDHEKYYFGSRELIDNVANQQTAANLSVGNIDSYNRNVAPKVAKDLTEFVSAAQTDLGVN